MDLNDLDQLIAFKRELDDLNSHLKELDYYIKICSIMRSDFNLVFGDGGNHGVRVGLKADFVADFEIDLKPGSPDTLGLFVGAYRLRVSDRIKHLEFMIKNFECTKTD